MLLVDTNVWLSGADGRSVRHADSVAVLREHQRELATTVPVIAETSWLILDRLGPNAQVDFLDLVTIGAVQRVDLTRQDWGSVVALSRQCADIRLDAVDASLVAVAERLKLDRIATYDHREFRAVRPQHIDSFELLP